MTPHPFDPVPLDQTPQGSTGCTRRRFLGTAWETAAASTAVASIGAALLAASPREAAAQPKSAPPAKPEIIEKSLNADDGAQLEATYFKSKRGKDAAAIILLHQERDTRQVWKGGLADRLQEDGFAVLTLNFRKLAAPKDPKPAETAGMLLDIEAAKQFLVEEHEAGNLNIRKLGIVAPGMAAPLALVYAAADWLRAPHDDAPTPEASTPRGQDIRALALLSPDDNLPGLGPKPNQAALTLRSPVFRVATMIGVGTKDKSDKGKIAREFHKKISGKDASAEPNYFERYDTNARGAAMLDRKLQLKVETHLRVFFAKHLGELKDDWRTRKSKLARQ